MAKLYSVNCTQCNTPYIRSAKSFNKSTKVNKDWHFCSTKCFSLYRMNRVNVSCKNCNKSLARKPNTIKKSKSGNHFCSRSCAATYNNNHKTYGTRRSKLETYIETQIKSEFPSLEFIANGKSTIGSELDFYFPSLKLAIEINGIFHHKPIFGKDKLESIQKNDATKVQVCKEHNITLSIVDCIEDCRTAAKLDYYWKIAKTKIDRFLV